MKKIVYTTFATIALILSIPISVTALHRHCPSENTGISRQGMLDINTFEVCYSLKAKNINKKIPPDIRRYLNKIVSEIITIGDEILIGQIIDTNSAWIAEKLNLYGIEIRQITSVHDDKEHITEALQKAEKNADLIILTGGLGPTIDDITKSVLCNYFDTKLIFHKPTFRNIEKLMEKRGIDMNRFNRAQAMVPESCIILPNKVGTAPGLWFEKNSIVYIALPGIPYEMKHIMENHVLPRLQENRKNRAIFHKTVLTQGLTESILSEKLENWEKSLPHNIKLAYLPDLFSVRIRLSATGKDKQMLKQQVETEIEKLKLLIPDHIFGYDNQTLAEVVGNILTTKGKTIALAENYTGGYISHLINTDSQRKKYFKGGITLYFNEMNKNILNIEQGFIREHGEASEAVAIEMARRIRKILATDYAVATTGISTPVKGTEESPSGTVWIAVAGPHGITTERFVFGDNYMRNIVISSQTALQMLRRIISKD
jgi:nicotinamide-nucleotide amidase